MADKPLKSQDDAVLQARATDTAADDSALLAAGQGGVYHCDPVTGAITRQGGTEPGVVSRKADGAPITQPADPA